MSRLSWALELAVVSRSLPASITRDTVKVRLRSPSGPTLSSAALSAESLHYPALGGAVPSVVYR